MTLIDEVWMIWMDVWMTLRDNVWVAWMDDVWMTWMDDVWMVLRDDEMDGLDGRRMDDGCMGPLYPSLMSVPVSSIKHFNMLL
jgi:hypothetical protein